MTEQFQSPDVTALLQAGKDHAALHTWDEAQAMFEAVLARAPAHAEAHKCLGDLHAAQGAHAKAWYHYREALILDPQMTEVYIALGDACRAHGDQEAAREAYQRAIDEDINPRRIARARAGLAALAGEPHQLCTNCGRYAGVATFRAYGGRRKNLCPQCSTTSQPKRAKWMWLGLTILAFVEACFFAVAGTSLSRAALIPVNMALLIGVAYVMILPHELAHGLIGWLLGARIFEIRIGAGPVVWEKQKGATLFSLRRYPLGGICNLSFPQRRAIKLRYFFSIAAGIVMSGSIALILRPYYNEQRLVTGIALIEMLVLVNAFEVINNLIPRKVNVSGVTTFSDGGHLLHILTGRQSGADYHMSYFVHAAQYAMRRSDFQRALEVSGEGLAYYPDSALLKNSYAIAGMEINPGPEITAAFLAVLEAFENGDEGADLGVDPSQRELAHTILRNNVAVAMTVQDGGRSCPAEARDYSQRAYEIMPWHPAVESTWGTVLLLQGRPALGLAYLQDALAHTEETRDRASTLAYIALAQHRLGDRDTAAGTLAQAQSLAPNHLSVRQIEALLFAIAKIESTIVGINAISPPRHKGRLT